MEVLRIGARELAPFLEPHGFEFVQTNAGPSSGGPFASGKYRRGDRRLALHVRGSLGLVTYHVGGSQLTHTDLTRAVRAVAGPNAFPEYPGFSDDPLDGFRHLGKDIRRFAQAFTTETNEDFAALVDWVARNPASSGLRALK